MNLSPTGNLFRITTPSSQNLTVPEYHPVTMFLEEEFKMDILALLKAERDKVARQLEGLNAAVAAFAGTLSLGSGVRGRGRLSAAARAKIAAAQRARWARIKGRKSYKSGAQGTRKRTMSAAAKAKIAAAQRARWAKTKQRNKTK